MTSMVEAIEIEDDDQSDLDSIKIVNEKPRRILFCIDVALEMDSELRPSANGGVRDTSLYFSSRLETVTRYIKRYVLMNKLIGNKEDQYAIILLKESAQWWAGLAYEVESEIEEIHTVIGEYGALNVSSLFNVICENIDVNDSQYFTQAILVFSRDKMPIRPRKKQFLDIRNSRNFTLDVVYVHGVSDSVQTIYDFWNEHDSKVNCGWYYETGVFQGKDNLARAFSQLLAHPLQRGEQERIEDFV